VTTFRKDYDYKDSRHPSRVVFGSFKEDHIRRDFTINALYKDITTDKIIDFCNGIADINSKTIRCVGNPIERFNEDKLRILRLVRFAGRLNFSIDEDTQKAAELFLNDLNLISPERISDEIIKICTNINAHKSLKFANDLGIFKIILPELYNCSLTQQQPQFHPEENVFNHILKMFESIKTFPISKTLALSVLFHDIGKPSTMSVTDKIRFRSHAQVGSEITENILRNFRFSKKIISDVSFIVKNHMIFYDIQNMRISKLKKLFFNPLFDTLLELYRLDCLGSNENLENYFFLVGKKKECHEQKKLPEKFIKGKDLIELGLKPSSLFKQIISDIYNLQLENKISSKKQAIDEIKKIYLKTN
jgi:poly(A) polymerase